MKTLSSLLVLLFTASLASADILNLTDGSKLEGTLKRENGGWSVTDANGKTTRVPDEKVAGVEKVSTLTPADQAASKLASQKRAVEALSDINVIIERWNKFIEQNKNTPLEKDARNELALWKDRLDKGMVKVGPNWITPAEQATMLEKSVVVIDQVRNLIKTGKYRDADKLIDQLVTVDPTNPAGHYLRGVTAFKQDQLGISKKSFEKTKELMPDHGPTLNNLAVIQTKQRQPVGALAFYDLAMQASPRTRAILDNVAEALNAIPTNQRNAASYTKAAKRFQEQDAELAKEMEKQGLFRWGATYVPAAQMDELKKAQEKVKEKLDLLRQDYERLADRVREVDNKIDSNERAIARINNDTQRVDPNGRIVYLRPPSIYYEYKRENDDLKKEKLQVLDKMDTFQEKAMRIQQDVPVPQFTGQQRIIEVEGTPLAISKPAEKKPATQPATKPAKN